MKPQTLIMLAVALGCGLAAMVMTQRFLSVPEDKGPAGKTIVVAAVDIKPGEKLNETLLKSVEWPEEVIPANAITDPKEILERSVRYPIGQNEVITMAKLAAEGVGPGLEPIIEEGKRAMSVSIKTHESAAGFIRPDSRVDVVLITKRGGGAGKAKTILQNLRVIAVNQAISSDDEAEEQKGHVIEMVTFLLTPEEAETLALAQNTGPLQLVLRNPVEDALVKTKGITSEDLDRGPSRLAEAAKKPEDGVKVEEGPSAFEGFFSKMMSSAAKAREKANEKDVDKEPAPVVAQIAPPPPEPKKRLVYRDLQGNVLMEVILDADDKIVESLHGLVEDVEPENGLASAVSPVATPAQPLETNDDAEFDSLFPDFEEPTTQDHHQDGNTR